VLLGVVHDAAALHPVQRRVCRPGMEHLTHKRSSPNTFSDRVAAWGDRGRRVAVGHSPRRNSETGTGADVPTEACSTRRSGSMTPAELGTPHSKGQPALGHFPSHRSIRLPGPNLSAPITRVAPSTLIVRLQTPAKPARFTGPPCDIRSSRRRASPATGARSRTVREELTVSRSRHAKRLSGARSATVDPYRSSSQSRSL
jgi:hypothetical protein